MVSPAVGRILEAVFGAILIVRRPRPIHPRGVVLTGRITWRARPPGREHSGIGWIDDIPSGAVPVVARASRSVGLPAPLPDVVGLALRIDGPHGPADLELASTGFGVPSRFWLTVHRSPSRARLGTLFPYRGSAGAVLICARTAHPRDLPVAPADLAARLAAEPWRLVLYWARPGSRWRPFADLVLEHRSDPDDTALRFDAVEHPLPGAQNYRWVVAVRQPSYRLARRSSTATSSR